MLYSKAATPSGEKIFRYVDTMTRHESLVLGANPRLHCQPLRAYGPDWLAFLSLGIATSKRITDLMKRNELKFILTN